jgi:hypothetical protein
MTANIVWLPVEGLAYSPSYQEYTINGVPIDLLDLPSNLSLCKAHPAPLATPLKAIRTLANAIPGGVNFETHNALCEVVDWLNQQPKK